MEYVDHSNYKSLSLDDYSCVNCYAVDGRPRKRRNMNAGYISTRLKCSASRCSSIQDQNICCFAAAAASFRCRNLLYKGNKYALFYFTRGLFLGKLAARRILHLPQRRHDPSHRYYMSTVRFWLVRPSTVLPLFKKFVTSESHQTPSFGHGKKSRWHIANHVVQ